MKRALAALAIAVLALPALAIATASVAAASAVAPPMDPATHHYLMSRGLPHVMPATGGQAAAASIVTVGIFDNYFDPAAIAVAAGTTVQFKNNGTRRHTVTASSPAGAFDSGYISPGASWSFTFSKSGTYVFHCEIHTGMAGTVTVDAAPSVGGTGAGVDISDTGFSPASLSVPVGAAVTWTNKGSLQHTVSGGTFASGRLDPGQSYTFTFTTAGTYTYVCDVHAGMAGTIIVGTAPPAPTPIPTPTPTATPTATATASPTSSPASTGTSSVQVMDDQFTPATLTVAAGTTVTWSYHGTRAHTVTRDGMFDQLLTPGATFSYTFSTAGTYAYYCSVHSGMNGTIVVTGSSTGPTPTPTSTPVPTPTPTPAQIPAGSQQVTVGDDFFSPTTLSVPVGTTVTWVYNGSRRHTVTGQGLSGSLSSSSRTYSYTFNAAGAYTYGCDFHPAMTGTIIVGSATPPPSPSPTPTPTLAPPPSLAPGAVSVMIHDNSFVPASLSVATGTTVTWVHMGSSPHTVTADSGAFDSGTIRSGGTYSYTFTSPGTYAYSCQFHGGMTGTITVTGSASATPAPTPSPSPTPTSAAPASPPPPTPGAPPTPAPLAPSGSLSIVIGDNVFDPGTTRVRVGTTVSWVNHGVIKHTVTSDAGSASVFDSGILSPNGVFSVTFRQAGRFPYICEIHPGMHGVIEVVDDGGAAPLTSVVTTVAGPSPTPTPTASSPPAPASPAAASVSIGDNFFDPQTVRVVAGAAVTWRNDGHLKHTITATDGSFTSDLLGMAAGYSRTFATPGRVAYMCALHPEMRGVVEVAAAATTATTTTTAAAATPAPDAAIAPRVAADADRHANEVPWTTGLFLGIILGVLAAAAVGGPIAIATLTRSSG